MEVKMNGAKHIGAHKAIFIERWTSYRVTAIDRFTVLNY